MKLEKLPWLLTVCKVPSVRDIDLNAGFYFIGRTDEEISLVCETGAVPACAIERADGWRAFRVQGTLDFSLIGILSALTSVLAAQKIGVFAVSTYNTDYVLVKADQFEKTLQILDSKGFVIV